MLITLPDRVLTSSIIGLRNLFLFLPDTEAILDFCNLQKFWKLGTSQKVIISSAFRVFQPHGSVMDTPGGTDAGVHTQTGKASIGFIMLNNIWNNKQTSAKTTLRHFNLNVKPVLLHGAETWRTLKSIQEKIQTFVIPRLLYILWPKGISNKGLLKKNHV